MMNQGFHKPHLSHAGTDNIDSLVQRMTDGLGSNKYKAVDYNQLQAVISEKRFGSIKTSMKVAKIEKKSQLHKENTILKQHQLIWQKEFLRLQHLCKKAKVDMEAHMRSNRESDICRQIYTDFDYLDAGLSADFQGFKKAATDPVWNLRDDLRYWLTENREELKLGSPDMIKQHAEIQKTVAEVKAQQKEIMGKLQHEQKRLEAELQTETLLELCPPPLQKHAVVATGIPQEAIDLACPDTNLKSHVLHEFLIIDEKYESMIDDLARRHALAFSWDEHGGWDSEEHFQFLAIYHQYPRELPNRRTLLFDRLRRHLPEKSYSQLSEHEDWWMDFKYYHERLKGIHSDFSRDRKELINKAQMVFAEAAAAQELEEVRNEYYHHQKQLCEVLYEKVKEWRERKMEAAQLEDQLNEQRRKEMLEIEKREKEAERRKRYKDKKTIDQYHQAKEEKCREREKAAEERLKELKKQLEEQAIIDRERIKFREEQLSQKLEEKRMKEEEKRRELQETDARLEALRAKVRVIAESDPLRTIQGTKAWDAHHKVYENEEIPMLAPLFAFHGYTSHQITSDHRVKLEQKLREAGLHTTLYAQQIIRGATPPTKPRRDQQHTFKFRDE